MWAVFKEWYRRVEDIPDIGLPVATNDGGRFLFRRATTDVVKKHRDCQFADDSALVATSHAGAQQALAVFVEVATTFGLRVNLAKTKVMPIGFGIGDGDCLPLSVAGDMVESVDAFKYLGSIISTDGRSATDIDSRIAGASRAFGALRRPIFSDCHLPIHTKRLVYEACVMSLLLYGVECWVPLRRDVNALSTFHLRCVRMILGITQKEMWTDRMTNEDILKIWCPNGRDDIPTRLLHRRMEWLGHLCRMEQHRTPRQLMFGSLLPTRPACGPRKRWRDVARNDVRHLDLDGGDWFGVTQDRSVWRGAYKASAAPRPAKRPRTECETCGRTFSRSGMSRHKCIPERQKPVSQQRGSRMCKVCGRWFRSPGGLAVHKCQGATEICTTTAAAPAPIVLQRSAGALPLQTSASAAQRMPLVQSCCKAHCNACGRCCRSLRGFQIHSCEKHRRATANR